MKRRKLIRVYKNLKAGGGVQSRLVEILPRLAEHFDVRLLCYRNRGERAEEVESLGVSVDVIKTGSKWAPWNTRKYIEYFRRHRPDIVHTHEYTANTLAIFAAHRAGVPVKIRHIHTMVPWGWGGNFRTETRKKMDVWSAFHSQTTLAVSDAVRRYYLEQTVLPSSSCRVLYNGIDLNHFKNCREERLQIRSEFGIPKDAPVVGTVGRLSRGKGHKEFIHAAKILSERIPHAVFFIVGEGGLRQELETLIGSLGIGNRVVFAGYRSDIPACLGAMDLFWFTSRPETGNRIQEGFGTAVVEAQAAGLPVVAFELPATDETMVNSVTGTMVPVGDIDGLADASMAYLSDPDFAEKASMAACNYIKKFSLDLCVDKTLKLYDELLLSAAS